MRLSVFLPSVTPQLLIDLKKLYQGVLNDEALTDNALRALIAMPDKQLFVTLFNARHLGALQVTIEQTTAQYSLLCVRDITRRRGVGKNLLNEVEKHLKEQGIERVQLSLSSIPEPAQLGLGLFMKTCGYQLQGQLFIKVL